MPRGAVLVVDDDVALAASLARSLSGLGWSADVAHTGRDALDVMGRREFDAIVLDLQMPEPNGITVIESLPPGKARPLAILLSGHLDVSATVRAVRAGAFDVLEKPVLASYLDERLQTGLHFREARLGSDATVPDAASRILGQTRAIQCVREQVRNVARFRDLSVVVVGEPGTGKELIAEAIHSISQVQGPFASVNCAAIPEPLFESELFGYEAPALTGARGVHAGLLESAADGTLFLDEIGEMPASLQPKLLKVFETGSFRRLGGTDDLPFRARVVTATNRRLNGGDGLFRSDLYFRLCGFTILAPSLRDREADIDLLASAFLLQFAERYPGAPSSMTPEALEALHAYDWPGNVRELKGMVQQAGVLARGPYVGVEEITEVLHDRRVERESGTMRVADAEAHLSEPPVSEPLRVVERRMIHDAWEASGRNLSAAARSLGLPRTTLRDRLKRYGFR